MDRLKQILFKNKSINSANQNISTNIDLNSSLKELPYNEISEIVDAYDVFSSERNSSYNYRITTTIKLLASNPLFNISGNGSIMEFSDGKFDNERLNEEYTFVEAFDEFLIEKDGWFGYYNPISETPKRCQFIDLEPKRERFNIINNENINVKNWDFLITYPAEIDDSHPLISDGILIVSATTGTISNIQKLVLLTPIKHNLIAGDIIVLTNIGYYNGEYEVKRIGLDDGKFKDYAFLIDLPSNAFSVGPGLNIRIKKKYLGMESKYYLRKFKRITEPFNYDLFNLPFSLNLFGDSTYQLVFHGNESNQEINISDLRDNLNRPISELYITVIKNRNSFFSVIKSGIYTPEFSDLTNYTSISNIKQIHNIVSYDIPTHTPIESNILSTNDFFYGDIVEYNDLFLKETVLGEINHRFNTINRDSNPNGLGPRPEGYMYKPHHKLEIRRFSNYIEENNSKTTIDIPDYATEIEEGSGLYIWRDLLPLGYNDGSEELPLDYPFLNGSHYLYSNLLLFLRRQDPFGRYNLRYNGAISDAPGASLNVNNFEINSGDDVC